MGMDSITPFTLASDQALRLVLCWKFDAGFLAVAQCARPCAGFAVVDQVANVGHAASPDEDRGEVL